MAKTYIGETMTEFYHGWEVTQVRSRGFYTRCKGYIARRPEASQFFVAATHYRDIKAMIRSANCPNPAKVEIEL